MDKTGADFEMCLTTIRDRLGVKAVPIQIPIAPEAALKGIVDLVRVEVAVRAWAPTITTKKFRRHEDHVEEARHYLIENAVELDDDAMEAYLSGEEVEVIKKCLRKAVLTGAFYPILGRLGLQEQGRPAPARRGGRRLSPLADRNPATPGIDCNRRADRAQTPATTSLCRSWPSRSWTTPSSAR